jgi:hypothetical protein
MSGIYQSLKTARRRGVEKLVGDDKDKEKDPEFDMYFGKFGKAMIDLNALGSAITQGLTTQKALFGIWSDQAKILGRMYTQDSLQSEGEGWPAEVQQLQFGNVALELKEVWDRIHAVYRSSMSMICSQQMIDPLRQTVKDIQPGIEADEKTRSELLTDYNAYKRRLAGFRKKGEDLEAGGKGGTPEAVANTAEIKKFEGI